MNPAQIRQSFLDFFASKQHTIVPSAPLLPSSPNLLFTNAGMNPFVPYFLGEREAPYPRAADTQKCIRAGGKHNDLDDVGLDTYHHTFFEMLGNWSFGDYFKKEAITWAWELLTDVWKFPKDRLYVTVYKPGAGDPADFDQEAYDIWAQLLTAAGLKPAERILYGNKKDNFWMMGDTGPCGPCSEIHIDLTPNGDSQGKLVNADNPYCIEIWNLVFIQFNAEEDGSFRPLKARHVDTGMGFERIAGIVATSKNFTDFSSPPSNYNSDLFTPIFAKISQLSGKQYTATLPANPRQPTADEMRDICFRVLADHIRTLSCSIADGILPGSEGRNYVLRRILRRAILYGRRLELPSGFFAQLIDPLIEVLGPVFPELKEQETVIRKVITSEENAFDRTIDRGIQKFAEFSTTLGSSSVFPGELAFELYDTYGFPLDLTQIIAAEHKLSVDTAGFEAEMEKQRTRARSARKSTVIRAVDDDAEQVRPTRFTGYQRDNFSNFETTIVDTITDNSQTALIFEASPFYAEMGGQIGDTGTLQLNDQTYSVSDTKKDASGRFLHIVAGSLPESISGATVRLSIDSARRFAIERHHSATHILHWALRKVLGNHVRQAGSLVDPERLRFDFAHFEAISSDSLAQIERLCNERILSNSPVQWFEVPFDQKPEDVIAFFGDKYGNVVRVVDIGGWSKELCGGTHVLATGEIGFIKITSESGIAAGVRRIEAVAGEAALRLTENRFQTVHHLATHLNARPEEVARRVQELEDRLQQSERELKSLKSAAAQQQASEMASGGDVRKVGELEVLACQLTAENPNELRTLGAKIHQQMNNGLLVVGAVFDDKVTVIAYASPAAITAGHAAGNIIRLLTSQLDGKGGGKPDFAMGGGSRTDNLASVLSNWQNSI